MSSDKLDIETVEREFADRFDVNFTECSFEKIDPLAIPHAYTASKRNLSVLDSIDDPIYSIKALFNNKRVDLQFLSYKTIVAPLNRSDLFTNRISTSLLFYSEDLIKLDWSQDRIDRAISNINFLKNQSSESNLKFNIVVIPDKSSVYKKFLVNKISTKTPIDIWKNLSSSNISDEKILDDFVSEAGSQKDFYLPNDSHLSVSGYMYLANKIEHLIEK